MSQNPSAPEPPQFTPWQEIEMVRVDFQTFLSNVPNIPPQVAFKMAMLIMLKSIELALNAAEKIEKPRIII